MNVSQHPNLRLRFRAPDTRLAGTIRYSIGRCIYGALLVARNSDGICAIFIGDGYEALHEQLVDAFPPLQYALIQSDLDSDLLKVSEFVRDPECKVVLDISIGGTNFQQRVWKMLTEIPAGQTRSYAQVAQQIGVPGAVRAVASACAANVLAIAIPCHRVVRSDGTISGYRRGPERKRDILRSESILSANAKNSNLIPA